MQAIPRTPEGRLEWKALSAVVAERRRLSFAGTSTEYVGPHQWWNSGSAFDDLSGTFGFTH